MSGGGSNPSPCFYLRQNMPRPRKIKKEDEVSMSNAIDQYFYESGSAIESKYGKEYVSSAVEEDKDLKYIVIPDLGIQWSLGRTGFALGRIIQVMGFEGAGKTSFALWLADLCMRAGGIAAMIETELAGSTEHMKSYLSNPDRFRIFHPETIEDAMSMTIDQLNLFSKIDPEAKIPKVLIMDSIAGATDARVMKDEENFIQQKVGGSAKVIKDATNLIKGKLKETNTLWVVLNQARDKIETGFVGLTPEIDKVIGSGGRAIPFAATYWLVLKRNAATKEDGEKSGFKSKGVWKKNKLSKPYREFHYNVKWGSSLDFVDSTTQMLALGNILGLQEIKGNKFFSDEIGIPREEAISAKELYALAHSPEYLETCQKELGIITEDIQLIYEPGRQRENGPSAAIPESITGSGPVLGQDGVAEQNQSEGSADIVQAPNDGVTAESVSEG